MIVSLIYSTLSLAHATALSEELLKNNQLKQAKIKNKEDIIQQVIDLSTTKYLFPKKAERVVNELKDNLSFHQYDDIADDYSLVKKISATMRKISGDMSLDIIETQPPFVLDSATKANSFAIKSNSGVSKIEILSGNVGYIKLDFFDQHGKNIRAISHAFDSLLNTAAIIIDVRKSEGESIQIAQYLMSYFMEPNTPLSKIVYAQQTKIKRLNTVKTNAPNKFKHDFPVYILTSAFSSSSAEFLSYTLQQFNKAVIVGEQTMGIAYVLQQYKINERFSIKMPIALFLHPKTNSNWQDIGVVPDLTVKTSKSLAAAHKLAKQHLGIF